MSASYYMLDLLVSFNSCKIYGISIIIAARWQASVSLRSPIAGPRAPDSKWCMPLTFHASPPESEASALSSLALPPSDYTQLHLFVCGPVFSKMSSVFIFKSSTLMQRLTGSRHSLLCLNKWMNEDFQCGKFVLKHRAVWGLMRCYK